MDGKIISAAERPLVGLSDHPRVMYVRVNAQVHLLQANYLTGIVVSSIIEAG